MTLKQNVSSLTEVLVDLFSGNFAPDPIRGAVDSGVTENTPELCPARAHGKMVGSNPTITWVTVPCQSRCCAGKEQGLCEDATTL